MTILGKQQRDIPLEEVCKSFGLDVNAIPKHVAIIMDGNGRWAKKKGLPRIAGHKRGMKTFKSVIKACADFGVHYLSVYAFSTENWKRPKTEVTFLLGLLDHYIDTELQELKSQGVRLKFKGDLSAFKGPLLKKIENLERETYDKTTIHVNVMLNYGSRDEITAAVQAISEKVKRDHLSIEEITNDTISEHLYTKDCPDPDVLIRTSGEERISNYMLWQISYSELIFTPTLWPDVTKEHLAELLKIYQDRHRRFGGL